MAATFSKEERLCGKTAISSLMNQGKWGRLGHFKFCFLSRDAQEVNRIMVSVPKKNFKRAVRRNLLKRRIREAYRLQKELLPAGNVDMMFIYSSKELTDFATVRESMRQILETICKRTSAK